MVIMLFTIALLFLGVSSAQIAERKLGRLGCIPSPLCEETGSGICIGKGKCRAAGGSIVPGRACKEKGTKCCKQQDCASAGGFCRPKLACNEPPEGTPIPGSCPNSNDVCCKKPACEATVFGSCKSPEVCKRFGAPQQFGTCTKSGEICCKFEVGFCEERSVGLCKSQQICDNIAGRVLSHLCVNKGDVCCLPPPCRTAAATARCQTSTVCSASKGKRILGNCPRGQVCCQRQVTNPECGSGGFCRPRLACNELAEGTPIPGSCPNSIDVCCKKPTCKAAVFGSCKSRELCKRFDSPEKFGTCPDNKDICCAFRVGFCEERTVGSCKTQSSCDNAGGTRSSRQYLCAKRGEICCIPPSCGTTGATCRINAVCTRNNGFVIFGNCPQGRVCCQNCASAGGSCKPKLACNDPTEGIVVPGFCFDSNDVCCKEKPGY